MTYFKDRRDAGEKLAAALARFRGEQDLMIVALPRGGVVLGRIVADVLGAPLDIVVPRKIGAPDNEEYAIGALTEAGHIVWNEDERRRYDPAVLDGIVGKEQAEAVRRLALYRGSRPARELRGKAVIIVDDGIATGFTMQAAIETVKSAGARRTIVAVPVAPPESVRNIALQVDEVVALHEPPMLGSIGAYYDSFDQVDDGSVISLLKAL